MDFCICCSSRPEIPSEEEDPLFPASAFEPAPFTARGSLSSGTSIPSCAIRLTSSLVVSILLASAWLVSSAPLAAAPGSDFDPEAVFATRCGACHTVGDGDDVGPDLAGVTERRSRDWLIPFIRSSQTIIQEGDKVAIELFERFGRTKMPDHPYSEAEIDQLLAYIEAGGPGDLVPRVRPATDATREEIATGSALFFGQRRFANGGAACADCHSVVSARQALNRSLGGDLQDVYIRYQDREITRALIQMSPSMMDEAYRDYPLTDEENFCLKAFLCQVADGQVPPPGVQRAHGGGWIPWIGLSLAMLVGILSDGSRPLRRMLRLQRRRAQRQTPQDRTSAGETLS